MKHSVTKPGTRSANTSLKMNLTFGLERTISL
uniref:Uncharacterized protein n=1 Tax=Anguilla anguilla TaxID=7936 RepID=A0A0E9QFT9_ANGAN